MKRILVVDGNSIINRAFYGVRALTTTSGKFTNAIYGMINIITRQAEKIKPDYAVVAFDLKAPTFRHKMYPEYKAGRHAAPPELLEQFPEAKECLGYLGFTVMEKEGYEADDIQGTVASLANSEPDTESYILTGDRDLLQLISDKITVLLVTNKMGTVEMHREQFVEQFGIEPIYYTDMKAIMGDKSDNIPGVAGIGEVGAKTLIANFKTLEGIYENLESPTISKGLRAKLEAGRESAFFSRRLAKIVTDMPLDCTLDDLKYREIERGKLFRKFTELELNSFITRFKLSPRDLEENGAASEEKKVEKIDPVSLLNKSCGFPAEKIAVCKIGGDIYASDGENSLGVCPISECAPLFSTKRSVICFGAKELLRELYAAGVEASPEVTFLDLSLYAYIMNPGGGATGISSLSAMFLDKIIDESKPYLDILFPLEEKMRERLKNDGTLAVLDEIEIPLLPILADMERVGMKIDTEGMREYSDALLGLANDLQEKIYFQAMEEFNINSPKQLGEVLFVKLGLPYTKKNNKNGFSTDAETLEELRQYSPIIDDILEYRQVTKLRGTYAEGLPKLADGDGRIHTDFKQTLTATGRLSSAEPNLQNIPIRTKMGRQMRKYFIPKEGYTLVDADYSQIELRILSHISGDDNMREAFIRGDDIHTNTAARVFGVAREAVNSEMRKRAKAVNFGIVYGISGFSLSRDIGTTVSEANKYIKSYLASYPGVDEYLTRAVDDAKADGFTTTLFGRRRYIPELSSPNGNERAFGKRIAMNAPIQGTAADIIKIAMIRVYNRLKADEPDARLIMQVHDELLVEAPKDRADAVRRILKEEMEAAVSLSIPLTASVTSGDNWLDQE